MFLYRRDDDKREAVSVKIAGHRNGPIGDVELYFRGERIKFWNGKTSRSDGQATTELAVRA